MMMKYTAPHRKNLIDSKNKRIGVNFAALPVWIFSSGRRGIF